jgi:hypothetical protein
MDPQNNTLRQPSPSTGLAIFYITIGTLLAIWGGVWYYFLRNEGPANPPATWQYYVCAGVFLSGIAIAIIGLLVGRIGQEAQNADTPIGKVTAAEVKPQGVPATAPAQPAAPVAAVPVQPVATTPPQTTAAGPR